METEDFYIKPELKEKLIKEKRKEQWRWVNLFIRDILLALTIGMGQYITKFNNPIMFFITGMMVVWVTWQISDFIKYREIS